MPVAQSSSVVRATAVPTINGKGKRKGKKGTDKGTGKGTGKDNAAASLQSAASLVNSLPIFS